MSYGSDEPNNTFNVADLFPHYPKEMPVTYAKSLISIMLKLWKQCSVTMSLPETAVKY